ncbi:CatA-like O-acetyltransferase [Vibrio sp. SS-MA-C1-2]|uniref:CatA-like O-acetyltransferase n=1 Tax=Vibrio sp. SS-MA-C1-2 TaxID=2908646 RepID=UPI001F1C9683|nr:CatA-like O-acetyltransferase [Vibrio sp. SS-MA-C1-2]UJF18733.1 CatA-like O-acetyltransferase [Vibrio sp. SS-MA-C1-2]
MEYTTINIENWNRREHFTFFQSFSHPWYNICANIDVTQLYQYCKENNLRFFHAYLYLTQQALNQCKPMAYRIVDDEVRVYSTMCVSVALLADDDTVRFCDLPYGASFEQFTAQATIAEREIKQSPFILEQFLGKEIKQNTVHLTILPWVEFTSMTHARDTHFPDSVPKMAFGKLTAVGEKRTMPFSVEVHHALMDGLHVGSFINTLQNCFNQPETLLKTSVN